ncbi:MAG: prolipoprotein diacylglyceryl transferase [Pseudomonadota bacterium]
MHYPVIDPAIFSVFGLPVRWYALTYIVGFAIVLLLGRLRAERDGYSKDDISDLVFYGAMGAVLGGRIGYVFFYNFDVFLADPLYLFQTWKGGMSFHGGLLGVLIAVGLFARNKGRSAIAVADFLAPLCPIGLGLGRLGNFINMELPGRITDASWGFIYQCWAVKDLNPMCLGEWETVARHPSPLYQAFTDGMLLFVIVWLVSRRPRNPGFVAGVFLASYGALRFATEFFRAPDAHIGFIAFDWLSMGQMLSLPMLLLGLGAIYYAQTSARKAA